MEQTSNTNPLFISLLFILRCIVPLLIMLGISYLLKRLGVIVEPPKPPPDWDNNHNSNLHPMSGEGGMTHA
jgi:hypothetical protein